ncbi:PTS sugar transporter subunit IIA [Lacticaseibacillus manihotivorans]|uniref:PTS sugar transporter subunit IIA n=1 Tax=Lacticaseibacillus manihotivorans TaxID=88233 RepID=UPI0034E2B736
MENGEGVTTTQTVHESQKVEVKDTATETTLFTPVKGQFMNLEDVPDDVFSKKMVGEGFAMNPEDGNIFAGVEGTVMTVFPTKHALGIHTENGAEVMIHLGLDTVELNGDPFDVKVKEGDQVHKDTPVATMDLKKSTSCW